MTLRPSVGSLTALLLTLVTPALGFGQERVSTENFVVTAPTKELAKTFGEYAEKYRREKAIDWLGAEMKPWPARCPLAVTVEPNRTGGETTFSFTSTNGVSVVSSQKMKIFGGVEQLLTSVLPHEVTHTVFAQHFGQAVPRWADEGGSVYSENDEERYQHDVRCRELLNGGKGFRLPVLFSMNKYPPDMHTLYAEGYSVVNFLVAKGGAGGRRRFLEFVRVGMMNDNRNWDQAAKQVYEFDSVDDLQTDWLDTLKATRPERASKGKTPAGPDTVATAANPRTPAQFASSARPQTRTSPVGVPQLDAPIVARGVGPAGEPQSRPLTPPAVLPLPAPIKLGAPELPPRR